MIFVNNISDLSYYNNVPGLPCFCEYISIAGDMYLTEMLSSGNGSYSAAIYVYSPDGLTQYETATSYFTVTYGVTPQQQRFFSAQLNTFSPEMCLQKCFIIRVVITASGAGVIFDKYTEQYCQTACCQTAGVVSFAQSGFETASAPSTSLTPITATDECGNRVIRLITEFTCYDYFRNQSYEDGFYKVSNFRGRLVMKPADLKREISFNCKVQRSERANLWLFEGFEAFPAWKMSEIQDQLLADYIYVDDGTVIRQLQFVGGTAFTEIKLTGSCARLFKLSVTLQECTVRQVFGCGVPCSEMTSYFVVPQQYQEGAFYADNGALIAYDYDELLQWFASQDGVTNVVDEDTSGLDCEVYKIASVQGTGLIPTSVYYDMVTTKNRIFAVSQETLDGICGAVGTTPCNKPVAGTTVIVDVSCATPVAGTTIIVEVTPTPLTIGNYGAWDTNFAETEASVYLSQVTLDIKSVNTTQYAIGSGDEITLINAIIGTMSADGRPTTNATLTSDNAAALTGDQTITITPTGIIYFSGTVLATDTNEVTIEFTGLVYNINN